MKYIYYIIAVLIVFSGLAAYGVFGTRVEVSKPLVSINDSIVSESEFEKMLPGKPASMSREQFIESVIDKQLLIQEAIKMDIHKEENFRRRVEIFYEQSLINILLDRKLDSLVVDVSNADIAKYQFYTRKTIILTKLVYPSTKDAQAQQNATIETIQSDFVNLSDELIFIVLGLNVGDLSRPVPTDSGVVRYHLDSIQETQASGGPEKEFDIKQVSLFIQDKKKEQLLVKWTDKIRQSAEIWRKK